jgi:phage shock protein PspC (stress-responsive transcriptional regulator)
MTTTNPESTSAEPAEPGGPAEPAEPAEVRSARPTGRLHRSRDRRMVAGVAEGLADYFDVDTTIVRVGFVALALCGGLAVPLYLAGWLLIPEEGSDLSVAEDLLGHHTV